MPFNFQPSDNMTDPDTNATRGIAVIRDCLRYADNDVGLAMACCVKSSSIMNMWSISPKTGTTWLAGSVATRVDHPGRVPSPGTPAPVPIGDVFGLFGPISSCHETEPGVVFGGDWMPGILKKWATY